MNDDTTPGYEITLRVPADEYDHVGAAITLIDATLRYSDEFDGSLPGYVNARRINDLNESAHR